MRKPWPRPWGSRSARSLQTQRTDRAQVLIIRRNEALPQRRYLRGVGRRMRCQPGFGTSHKAYVTAAVGLVT